jgi:hypothetical protein
MHFNLRSILVVPLLMMAGCSSRAPDDTPGDSAAEPVLPRALLSRHAPAGAAHVMERSRAARRGARGAESPLRAKALKQKRPPALEYLGGPILESVEVRAVFWGTNVAPGVRQAVGPFLSSITAADSAYMSVLGEYDVAGMTIGSGTFQGAIVDVDAPVPADGFVTDAMVEAEASRLVDTGLLPAENGHGMLVFYFPPGVVIEQTAGALSCQSFCGYHSSFTRSGNKVYYAVLPDQASGGCETGCGTHGAVSDTLSVTAHELVETVTDPDDGDVTDDTTLGWIDLAYGEVADQCGEWEGQAKGYTVKTEWSNAANGCTDHPATSDVSIVVPYDDTRIVDAGGTATFPVQTSGSSARLLELATNLDATEGFAVDFDPPRVHAGEPSTLTVHVPAGLASQDRTFHVHASEAGGVHHYAVTKLHVRGAAPVIASADRTSGPSSGGTQVTLRGTGFGPYPTAKICPTSGCTDTDAIEVRGNVVDGSQGRAFSLVMPSYDAGNGATVDIVVTNTNDDREARASFRYTRGGSGPRITSIDPPSAPLGWSGQITIRGSHFASNAALTFAGVPLAALYDYEVVSDRAITVYLPPATDPGPVDVQVTSANGQTATRARAFEYGPNVPPSIDHLSVGTAAVAGGAYVTVFGAGFDAPTVTVGGALAVVKSVNPGFLGIIVPPHRGGDAVVTVTNGDGQRARARLKYDDCDAP